VAGPNTAYFDPLLSINRHLTPHPGLMLTLFHYRGQLQLDLGTLYVDEKAPSATTVPGDAVAGARE
jgi:hypothetical protein